MPLHEVQIPGNPTALLHSPEEFLIFYSSRDEEGRMWCPDCRAVEALVKETFDRNDGPTALVVYVGQKADWKTASNQFRGEPWNISAVPTVIKRHGENELGRLVEDEIEERLSSFAENIAA